MRDASTVLLEKDVVTNSKRPVVATAITAISLAMLGLVVATELRKTPKELSTDALSTSVRNTQTLALPANSVDFVTRITDIPDIAQSCTEILRGNSSETVYGIVIALLSGLSGGPTAAELKKDACSNPGAAVPCSTPDLNVVVDCDGSRSSSSGSGTANNCYDPFQLSSLMHPANKLLEKINADCEQDTKGNSTATCGESGKGRVIFNSSTFFPVANTTVDVTGSFDCSNGTTNNARTHRFMGRGVSREYIPSKHEMHRANKSMQPHYR